MFQFRFLNILPIFFLFISLGVQAKDIPVNNSKELIDAVNVAQPGDHIKMASGEWRDVFLKLKGKGSSDAPVYIEAEIPGMTQITGESALLLSGEYLHVSGLHFKETVAPNKKDASNDSIPLFAFGYNREETASHSTISHCYFESCNPENPDRRYPWVKVLGRFNTVEFCRFENQAHNGVTVQVMLTETEPTHQIQNNYFLNRPKGRKSNGYESVQLGQSWSSEENGRIRVENNIFESCDGETEILSSKTCENVIENNLFLRSRGTLTLRHGDRSRVENNYFIGGGKDTAGGIRIIGRDHVVRHNYFEDLVGYTGGIIVLYNGIPDSPLNGYFAAHRAVVEDNLLVENKGVGFYLNGGYPSRNRILESDDVVIRGNQIHQIQRGNVLVSGDLPGLKSEKNYCRSADARGNTRIPGFLGSKSWVETLPNGLKSVHFVDEKNIDLVSPLKFAEPVNRTQVGPKWMSHIPLTLLADRDSLHMLRVSSNLPWVSQRTTLLTQAKVILGELEIPEGLSLESQIERFRTLTLAYFITGNERFSRKAIIWLDGLLSGPKEMDPLQIQSQDTALLGVWDLLGLLQPSYQWTLKKDRVLRTWLESRLYALAQRAKSNEQEEASLNFAQQEAAIARFLGLTLELNRLLEQWNLPLSKNTQALRMESVSEKGIGDLKTQLALLLMAD